MLYKWIAVLVGYYYFRFPGAIFGYFTGVLLEQYSRRNFSNNINSADFEINLLALASTVIKADGSVKKQELEFVRNFFIGHYGQDKAKKDFLTVISSYDGRHMFDRPNLHPSYFRPSCRL